MVKAPSGHFHLMAEEPLPIILVGGGIEITPMLSILNTVMFSKSDKSIPWDPSADSLLEFAESNGIEVESGCRAGSCGSYQTGLAAGKVDYHQESDADVDSGHCLLCISTPSCLA